MMRKSTGNRGVLACGTLVAILLLAGSPAQAQVKPFKITGEGVGPLGVPLPGQPMRPHWIEGNATHLGRHEGEGFVQTDTAEFHPDGTITGEFGSGAPFVFTGANGDILACHYGRTDFGASTPGTFELVPLPELGPGVYMAFWVAEFVPVADECTGKFAGVSGSWVMYAQSEPFILGSSDPIAYSWHGEGQLTFQKAK
jgi:hypothetical protein